MDLEAPIYKNDPMVHFKMLDKFVQVSLGKKTYCTGFLRAYDPVTESVILNTPLSDGRYTYQVIIGDKIKEIVVQDPPEGWKPKEKINLTDIKSEDVEARKQQVISWLKKNLLPVEEEGNDLIISQGMLRIAHPFRTQDCISSNPAVLGSVQELLERMPNS